MIISEAFSYFLTQSESSLGVPVLRGSSHQRSTLNALRHQLRDDYGRYVMIGLVHNSAQVSCFAFVIRKKNKWEYRHVYPHALTGTD